MASHVLKSSPHFFVEADEKEFSARLRRCIPSIEFVDGSVWLDTVPPCKARLDHCERRILFLWDRTIVDRLPVLSRKDGRFQGPSSGVVIQYRRCLWSENVLLSGDIGTGYSKPNPAMAEFVRTVWRVLRSLHVGDLESYDPESGQTLERGISVYLVGEGACRASHAGVRLKHCLVDVHYRMSE